MRMQACVVNALHVLQDVGSRFFVEALPGDTLHARGAGRSDALRSFCRPQPELAEQYGHAPVGRNRKRSPSSTPYCHMRFSSLCVQLLGCF